MGNRIVGLANWSVVGRGGPYTPPEARVPALQGAAFGHPKHRSGKTVITSQIEAVAERREKGRLTATYVKTASGTIYCLTDVDPNYEKTYRGARERLLASYPVFVL